MEDSVDPIPGSIHSELGEIAHEDSDDIPSVPIKKFGQGSSDEEDDDYLQPQPYHIFSFLNVVYGILAYALWIVPCFGCFGCHWFLTFRKVHNPLYLCHSFVRIFLICFFNAVFWFTRLFICDYRFMSYPGFIPWDDKPSCRDGEVHAGGDCYGSEVSIFLMIHLTALFFLFLFWLLDGCCLGICEIWLNATSRKRRNFLEYSPEHNFGRARNLDGRMSIYKGSCFGKGCYGFGMLVTVLTVSFTLGLFYTWFLSIITAGYGGANGSIQGIVSLVISSLLSILTVISGSVWVFLYCVS